MRRVFKRVLGKEKIGSGGVGVGMADEEKRLPGQEVFGGVGL